MQTDSKLHLPNQNFLDPPLYTTYGQMCCHSPSLLQNPGYASVQPNANFACADKS